MTLTNACAVKSTFFLPILLWGGYGNFISRQMQFCPFSHAELYLLNYLMGLNMSG